MSPQSTFPIYGEHSQLTLGPLELVVLQGTSFCNLNCDYCYLTQSSRKNKSSLSLSAITPIFAKLFTSRLLGKTLHISWHSGEPLVLNPSYYDAAIRTILDLREEYRNSELMLKFDIQTNGTLINQEWCEFFKRWQEYVSVGVSCDGPAFLHDAHRVNWTGKPTHQQTCRGMRLLCGNGIKFDLIAVVSPHSLDYPREFYEFFCSYKDHVREFHFNVTDEFSFDTVDLAARDECARKYYRFLRSLLEIIKHADTSSALISIRNFSEFYDRVFSDTNVKQQYEARNMSRPFRSLSIDVNGNVSTFYAGLTADESRDLYGDRQGLMLGNLLSQELEDIAQSDKLRKIAKDFESSHRACETSCDYFPLCSGGYNLIKHKRFGTFEATETPECFIQVKTFANALLEDLSQELPE